VQMRRRIYWKFTNNFVKQFRQFRNPFGILYNSRKEGRGTDFDFSLTSI